MEGMKVVGIGLMICLVLWTVIDLVAPAIPVGIDKKEMIWSKRDNETQASGIVWLLVEERYPSGRYATSIEIYNSKNTYKLAVEVMGTEGLVLTYRGTDESIAKLVDNFKIYLNHGQKS